MRRLHDHDGVPPRERGLPRATNSPTIAHIGGGHALEPATGTDCSAIFAGSKASPLAAADLAERFLDSGAAEGYQPGVRYFFGHPIPD